MSVNKYLPHVFVMPEDDANREIANGFLLNPSLNARAIQVLPPSGGWLKVLHDFETNQRHAMSVYSERLIVLLIDFDEDDNRLAQVKESIGESLAERVFVLGVFSEPEALRRNFKGSLENIGSGLAADCQDGTKKTWQHELLRHNETELDRMTPILRPILFPPT